MTATIKSAIPPQRRKPRAMTERRLENIAAYYLQRYGTSAANLQRVLQRRVDKRLAQHIEGQTASRAEMYVWIERLAERYVNAGAVNDQTYAEGLTRKLRRLGKSPAKIRARLAANGVAAKVIDLALAETRITETGEDATFVAALAYAKRRKLGPFRSGVRDRKTERKDMGALARAGFSFDIVRQVMAYTCER